MVVVPSLRLRLTDCALREPQVARAILAPAQKLEQNSSVPRNWQLYSPSSVPLGIGLFTRVIPLYANVMTALDPLIGTLVESPFDDAVVARLDFARACLARTESAFPALKTFAAQVV